MGVRDRLAKALNLPAGAITQTEQQIAAQVPASGTTAQPLDRNPADRVVPFAPGGPLIPALINPPREDGRALPRRYEFPVAWNLQITEQRVVPFRLLREVAEGSDLVRKCIEVIKGTIAGLDWDISLSPDAVERIMAEPTTSGHTAATREARRVLLPDIMRCRDFWQMPDRINGLSFPEWIGLAIEEMLVIDALTIYPNHSLDDNLHSLEILDGATIKPLLDDRGGRPLPPYPAYQQILWGFPRGEFTASADADGEFSADDLIYSPRTRRTNTPYGFSAVERALPVIDLYMKRLQWLRTEFTDGVTPEVFMRTDATYGGNPEILRAYERIFNDELSGKIEARRRAKMLPEGMDPVFPPGLDMKYKPEFDEYLVKQICGHFGVMPTQIGFASKSGLGGKGVQQGEAASSEMMNIKPMIMWLTDLCNQLSYRFLGMPKDLTFVFQFENAGLEERDAKRRMEELQSGQKTINEARAELGLPLFTFPEADMPFVLSTLVPAGSVEEILADEGINPDDSSTPPDTIGPKPAPPVAHKPTVEGEDGPKLQQKPIVQRPNVNLSVNPTVIELDAFAKWTKGSRKREFMFEFVDSAKSVSLNALAKHDPAAARELASMLKSKKDDSFAPPDGVRSAAKRALEWIADGKAGDGFTDVGRKRASDLAGGASISAETIGRMVNFFSRHEGDKKAEGFNSGEDGYPSPGRVAWDAWGGDAGKSWAESVYARISDKDAEGDARGRDSAPEGAFGWDR